MTDNASNLVKGSIPRYVQLSGLFRRRIETSDWPVGKQIPTVEELSNECGVAKATIRQALGLLEDEGLVSRYRAKGTYVNKKPQDLLWLQVETDWNGLISRREGVRIEVISQSLVAKPQTVPHQIGTLAESYCHLRRIHLRDDTPFLMADVYIDQALASKLDPAAFSETTALQLVAGIEGVEIKDARQTLTIGATDIDSSQLLKVPLNSPVAKVDRSASDANGTIIMISNGVYRGDIVRVDLEMKP